MSDLLNLLLWATGLVLIVEGLAYALAPSLVERLLAALAELPLRARRLVGWIAMATGGALVSLAQAIFG